MNGILQSTSMQFTQEARLKQDDIDQTNEQIAQLSALQKIEQQRLESLRARIRARQDRAKRIANLRTWLDVQKMALSVSTGTDIRERRRVGYADTDGAMVVVRAEDLPAEVRAAGDLIQAKASDGPSYLTTPIPADLYAIAHQNAALIAQLPSIQTLRQRLEVYIQNNMSLADRSQKLKEKDGQQESMYRKIVALCTKTDEEKVDMVLEGLVQALDSDPLDGVEVGRVREFLRKVEGVDA